MQTDVKVTIQIEATVKEFETLNAAIQNALQTSGTYFYDILSEFNRALQGLNK